MVSSDLSSGRGEDRAVFICWFAYTAAYVGRLDYVASIVAIISDLGETKARAGLVSSAFFFAYGVGQLVNGVLSKRYNAKIAVFFSLSVSAVLNLIMPLCGDISIMKYVWFVNGAIQSALWSSLIKTLADFVSDEKLPRAILSMSASVTVGTFVAYGASAASVKLGDWRLTFYFASAALAIGAAVWFASYDSVSKRARPGADVKEWDKVKPVKTVVAVLALAAVAGVADGFVKDGVNAWVPSVLYEEFGISPSFSILLALLLPVVATLSAAAVKKIREKIASHSAINLIFFIFSTVLCFGVVLSLRFRSLILIMLCFVGVAVCAAAINNVVTSMLPLDYRRLVNAGEAAGALNACSYLGSVVASFSLGAISQTRGWNAVFVVTFAVCAAAAIICFAGLAIEKRLANGSPR